MNNNKKALKKEDTCSPTENWIRFLFSLSCLCVPLASAGIFRWVRFTVAPEKGYLHFQRGTRGSTSEGGYYLMRSSSFWFAHMPCVPRVAGMVPREDVVLTEILAASGISAERFLFFWIQQRTWHNPVYPNFQGGWCHILMHTLFYLRGFLLP